MFVDYQDRVSFYSPGWPRIHRDPPASSSRVLGLNKCATTVVLFLLFCLCVVVSESLCACVEAGLEVGELLSAFHPLSLLTSAHPTLLGGPPRSIGTQVFVSAATTFHTQPFLQPQSEK